MKSVLNRPPSLPTEQVSEVPRSPHPRKPWYIGFFIITTLFIVSATLSWILSILGVISGPWPAIIPALFAGLACLMALCDFFLKIINIGEK